MDDIRKDHPDPKRLLEKYHRIKKIKTLGEMETYK